MSTRVGIIRALKFVHGRAMTAMELHEALGGWVSLGTLSGELNKLSARGVLHREPGVGPRGGYGYTLVEPDRWAGPRTAWTFILEGELL